MQQLEKPNLVRCLGWCGKSFQSTDKFKNRFCKPCSLKKEQLEKNASGIRVSNLSITEE